ncbi:MAG: hypothetical protein FWD71_20530 [Oscillospiraceae bacterium]|nr:hypothetical protein [Oscillospiraceae bacterium]
MNNRERTMAVLNYQNYDKMPIVHFGYWWELLQKWHQEGHLTKEEADGYGDGNEIDKKIADKLGFDFCWTHQYGANNGLMPQFEYKVLEQRPDGFVIHQNGNGLIEETRPGAGSIPATVGTLMTGREAWEELYKPRLQPGKQRYGAPEQLADIKVYLDNLADRPAGAHAGSLYGSIRDMLGVEGLSYLYADDEDLYIEIIDTIGNICYENMKAVLESGVKPDFLHYWEDICFKNGPLVNPEIFKTYVAPYYKKISELAHKYEINIISLDCDGCIDKLVPIWLQNGVNTMFPIEVGTWNASIRPWREAYGRELRGVGGMNKNVLACDFKAVDGEIERLKPLVDLGGFIPCPDHRLPPNAGWDNTRYYCDQMRKIFG